MANGRVNENVEKKVFHSDGMDEKGLMILTVNRGRV